MQPQRRGSSDAAGRGRPLAIPGARPSGDWAVVIGGDSASGGGESVPSTHEGLFGSSLRRHHSEQGGYGSSLGHSLGHGAWLSSSLPRGSGRPPPGMHKSPSLGRQYSGACLAAHEEEEEHAAAAAAAAAAATAGAASAVASPTAGRPSLDRRHSVDQAAASPEALHARPQRWHLGAAHTEPSATSELAEPLLSAELSDPGHTLPGTPHSQKAGDAAPGAPGGLGPAEPAGPGVVVARDVTGADRGQGELSRALVFGAINSVATIPALVAYAAIVFKEPIYAPYIDQLCKFFFLSSAIHQAVFCLLSTLPFSVGQVQDVGLIFLSAMASSIAGLCLEAGRDAATALGTSLLTMSAATFFTGAMTLLVARYKLAQLVQYLPLPVIGGYLSFVGYFCVASGIGLGVSQDIGTIASWIKLFQADALVKLVPTALSCLAMILTLERFSHPLALPAVMLLINLAFHAARLALGVTLEQAMDANWVIRPAEGEQYFWQLWDLFNIKGWSLSGIYFPAMTAQVVKMLGLALVVIFGSAMDIAAIQQDTPKKIDFNRELVTVAVSNMATGVAGCGYTGSYIFSQTIFTMRAGVYSRWNGVVVAASEFAMFALPFPVIQYMPNFFFGALLLWFGIEISRDWLLLSFTKMTRTEYGLLLATFGAIMQWGLEGGIAAGIVLATLYFAAAYAQSQVASIGVADTARSTVVRTVEQQAALDMLGGRLACISLNGFVFFGCANSIGQRLQEEAERLGARFEPEAAAREQAELEEAIVTSLRTVGERYVGVKHTQAVAALTAAPSYLVLDLGSVRGLDATGARTMGVVHMDLAQHGVVLVVTGADHHGIRPLMAAHGVPLPPQPLRWPPEPAQARGADVSPRARGSQGASPRSRPPSGGGMLTGADGSPLESLAAEQPWESGSYPQESEEGLQATCLEFTTLEEGLRYCEDQLLEVAVRYGLCPAPSALLSLEAMLASHLQKLPLGGLDPAGAAAALRRYMSVVSLSAGQLLWKLEDAANELFIIEKGTIRVDEFIHEAASSTEQRDDDAAAVTASPQQADARQARRTAALKSASAASLPDRVAAGRRVLARSYECGPGCVVGSTDFYLARPHGTRAVCRSAVARVLRVSRSAMERMAAEVPQALNVLQLAVMRANTLDLFQAAAQRQACPP